jgi:hypothetical protein
MDLDIKLKKSEDIVVRDIDGQKLILPLYKSTKLSNCFYALNETAASFWDLVDGKTSLGKIRKSMIDRYDVSEEELDKQLPVLIKDLKSIKVIL